MKSPYKRISVDKYGRISLTERRSRVETELSSTIYRKQKASKPVKIGNQSENKSNVLRNKPVSRRTCSNVSDCSVFVKLFTRAEKALFKKKAKIAKEKRLKIKNEMKECTFRPKTFTTLNSTYSRAKSQINKSKNVISSRSKSNNMPKKRVSLGKVLKSCECLYSNYKTIRANKEKLKIDTIRQTCPFKPEISAKPKIGNFFERLQNWCLKSTKNKQKLKEKLNYDKETKQALFHPRIGESRPKRTNSLKKANYLYLLHNTRNRSKTEKQLIQEMSLNQMANRTLIDPNSEKIYWRKIEKAFRAVFSKIEKNDKISKDCTKILNETKEIKGVLRDILRNILVQLEGTEIDREEFVSVAKSVFTVSS